MERSELLARLQSSRAEWDALIASVPPERLLDPVWADGWTIKDIVALVDFYEWWVAEFIRTRDWPVVDPSVHTEDLEARNTALYELNKNRELEEVLGESASIHNGLVDAFSNLTDAEYNDRALLFPPPDEHWTLARMVEGNTWDHYTQHIPQIRTWLDAG